ncbi:S-adenosyl-L-methionine-dependent methyltransferase [Aspergillus homomorphus CBS 101889]|uniref:S-adenosyl-L-methionine-dependent methyltransferase n=1 Tax=Aspergillus homomorphus (strain CBS 101889) TaxID=1450537 RepID=A0A395HIQ9_ASPHC|nr:S-adenosyl-L-methionine-dependent methyltransferase [Aspergillus homomorphus CBS 101889]RAL07811.1 S-adenosyl-L-methionine-dependent methyltransferase [Aspergillus homomorphus CBS 101889]
MCQSPGDSRRLLDLAASISTATTKMDAYLKERNLPYPSFEPNAPQTLPRELQDAKDSILDAASELHDLLTDPLTAFFESAPVGFMSLMLIQRFGIADLFGPEKEMSFALIAEKTGLSEGVVKNTIRHAMTMRVFREPRKGFVGHTPRSMAMRDGDMARFMEFAMEELTPGVLSAAKACEKWPQSGEPNHTGFSLSQNTDLSLYETLAKDPVRAARMANAMHVWATSGSYPASRVVNEYDWGRLGAGTVVDVGGSRGHVAVAIASRFPSLKFMVQDLPSTIAGAEADLPPQLADRVSFMAHNFFQEQPVVASAYFFRWIFHNWSDNYCIKILRALIPALRPGALLIVNEICMPEPGEIPVWRERLARTMTLGMISMFNSYERDLDDWTRLFQKADPRFQFVDIQHITGTEMALIEVKWTGE